VVEDIVGGTEDAVGEPVGTKVLPDVFGGVKFGRARGQEDWRDVVDTNLELSEQLLIELVNAGIMTDSDPQQTWYVSDSHTSEDIAQTLDKFETALHKALRA
jgi:glutamate-1-semialdehyde aminotransferase